MSIRLESNLNIVKEYRGRFPFLVLALLLFFSVLAWRLVDLQILKGERHLDQSEDNFIQERLLHPLRGRILDAEGRRLAGNRPAYDVYLTPAFVKGLDATLLRLEGYLNLSEEEQLRVRHPAEQARGLSRFREILVKNDIPREQLAVLESHKLELPGVAIRTGTRREYPEGKLTSHVIGYVGRISDRELKKHPGYHRNDHLGKKGVERAFEESLRGRTGRESVVVDAHGRMKGGRKAEVLLKGENREDPVNGLDVRLSLDLDLQRVAEETFTGFSGGVVAMDVETGFLLVWLSKPGFDPNLFAGGISKSDWERYRSSILDPLMDKVVQASYYPGSTYKVVPALAALDKGAATVQTSAFCTGGKRVSNHMFHCWNRGGHGNVNLHRALRESCDVYFYTVGELAGYEAIYDMAHALGLGQRPGIGFNSETEGRLPTVEWHEKIHKRPWWPGDTLSHSIGQGDLKVSPLQMAVLYAAIANGGRVMTPQVVLQIQHRDGTIVEEFKPRVRRTLSVRLEYLEAVRQGLEAVVNEPGGTGRGSRLETPHFSGKTGTAQVVRLPENQREHDDYLLKDHGWFVGYAPSKAPKIVVAAVVEHGEHGSWVAPVIREVVAAWYEKHTGEKAKRPPWTWWPPKPELPSLDAFRVDSPVLSTPEQEPDPADPGDGSPPEPASPVVPPTP